MMNLYQQQQALGASNSELISLPELTNYLDLPNKNFALMRLAENSQNVINTKLQIISKIMQNYSLVWSIVNGIYQDINAKMKRLGIPSHIPLFTDPEQLPVKAWASQIYSILTVKFQHHPELAQAIPFNKIMLYIHQESLNGLISSILGTNNLTMLETQLQMLESNPLATSAENSGGASNAQAVASQTMKGAMTPQMGAQASGASAQQPATQQIEQGSTDIDNMQA